LIVGIDMGGTNIDGVIIDKGKIINLLKGPPIERIFWHHLVYP